MAIEVIASGAIAVLTPFLVKTGEAFADTAGKRLAEKAGALYTAIRNKFKGDDEAEQTLALVEAKPDSMGRISALEEVLSERMQADPDFAATLNRLVLDAKEADSRKVLVFGERNIAVDGNVTGSTFITGDSNTVAKS